MGLVLIISGDGDLPAGRTPPKAMADGAQAGNRTVINSKYYAIPILWR